MKPTHTISWLHGRRSNSVTPFYYFTFDSRTDENSASTYRAGYKDIFPTAYGSQPRLRFDAVSGAGSGVVRGLWLFRCCFLGFRDGSGWVRPFQCRLRGSGWFLRFWRGASGVGSGVARPLKLDRCSLAVTLPVTFGDTLDLALHVVFQAMFHSN